MKSPGKAGRLIPLLRLLLATAMEYQQLCPFPGTPHIPEHSDASRLCSTVKAVMFGTCACGGTENHGFVKTMTKSAYRESIVDGKITIGGLGYCGSTAVPPARRISCAVPIASTTLDTTCAARRGSLSSPAFDSSSSACARMIPS